VGREKKVEGQTPTRKARWRVADQDSMASTVGPSMQLTFAGDRQGCATTERARQRKKQKQQPPTTPLNFVAAISWENNYGERLCRNKSDNPITKM
jgi:hypothetical protein